MKTQIFRTLLLPLTIPALVLLSASSLAQTREAPLSAARVEEPRAATTSPQSRTSRHKIIVSLGAPTLRTLSEVEATHASPKPRAVPFLPTMGTEAYRAAKAAANQLTSPEAERHIQRDSVDVITQEAQPVPFFSFAGVDQATAGGYPPDTHGAIGANYFVEVTNFHLDVYTRSGLRVKSTSLNDFFQYYAQSFFDPRVIYDAIFDRWVIFAPAGPESPTTVAFVAASASGDPLGTWYIWNFNVGQEGRIFDYPQLGVHSQALIVTASIFEGTSFLGANIYTIPLNYLYSGANPVMRIFPLVSSDGTLAPPIVRDTHASAFLVSAPGEGSALRLFELTNLLIPSQTTLTGPTNVSVPAYGMPPSADQPAPCTHQFLDTVDARFVNASTQVGNSLWQVHTILVPTPGGARPRPRYYQIDTYSKQVIEYGTFSGGASSYDFNASIAATDAGDVYVNWSSTDPSRGVNAQVLVSGRRASDPWGVIPAGLPVFTSSTCRPSDSRWGDYSAVTVDPTNSLNAWVVNETIKSATEWGSRIGQISF